MGCQGTLTNIQLRGAIESGRSFKYDSAGRLIAVQKPDGNVLRYSWDVRGRLTSLVDEGGGTNRFAYDGRDNLIRWTDPGARSPI